MNKNKGFTLTELLVVIFIMTVVSGIVMARYRSGERLYILQIAAQEVMGDIREVQNMALSGQTYQDEAPLGGFGINFRLTAPSVYTIFADLDGDHTYDAGELIEEIDLNSRVQINSLAPAGTLNIVFTPPRPTVYINGATSGSGTVTLRLIQETGTKTITITSTGVIEIN